MIDFKVEVLEKNLKIKQHEEADEKEKSLFWPFLPSIISLNIFKASSETV